MEGGATSIEPLTQMAIWLIRGGSEKRDMEAAQQFFRQALAVVGHSPEQVTTDGHASYPRAVREILGENAQHRTNKYLHHAPQETNEGCF
jgi:putative transposase